VTRPELAYGQNAARSRGRGDGKRSRFASICPGDRVFFEPGEEHEKCGFGVIATERNVAEARSAEIEELVLRLDELTSTE
jgi:hypothetical protein